MPWWLLSCQGLREAGANSLFNQWGKERSEKCLFARITLGKMVIWTFFSKKENSLYRDFKNILQNQIN